MQQNNGIKLQINFLSKKTPLWLTLLTIVFSVFGIRNGCVANRVAHKSTQVAQEANAIARDANKISKESFNIASEVYKSKDIPRLVVFPLTAQFYVPEKPEVPGQVKIDMSAMIENLSEANARDVALNFETEDWYGHGTSLFQIYQEMKQPIPHIASLPKNSRFPYPSYAPDAPATGEAGFVSQNKPFKLRLTLYWKDINYKDYVYVGFYQLKSSQLLNGTHQLYFQPVNIFDSVKDGQSAWDRAKQPL